MITNKIPLKISRQHVIQTLDSKVPNLPKAIMALISVNNFYGNNNSGFSANRTIQIPRGLSNFGNNCYVNSAIQTLFSFNFFMNPLKEFYESFSSQFSANKKESLKEQFPVLSRLINLFDTYKSSTNNNDLSDFVKDFKIHFGEICDKRFHTQFKSCIQQDAAEFFSLVLQIVEEEINAKKLIYKFNNKLNPVEQHFHYKLANQEKCYQCGQVTKLEPECISTFHLQLTSDRALQSAFLKRLGKEESSTKCSKCNVTQTLEKSFEKLPKVLIFQAGRYSESFIKDSERIHASHNIYLPRSYIQKPNKVHFPPLSSLCKTRYV